MWQEDVLEIIMPNTIDNNSTPIPMHAIPKYIAKIIETNKLETGDRFHLWGHINVADSSDIKKIFIRDGMVLRGSIRSHCLLCGLKSEASITKSIQGDYVSIDGKVFFIPSTDFVLSPIPVNNQGVEISVRYVTTLSGLPIPIDYIDSETVEKIKRIDSEYASIPCDSECPENYSEFKLLERKTELLREQISIILDRLERVGFKIEESDETITITSPDGKTSTFKAFVFDDPYSSFLVTEYSGEFALLGEIILTKRYLDGDDLTLVTDDRLPDNICVIRKGKGNTCNGKVVIFLDSLPEGDTILAKTIDATDNATIAISVDSKTINNVLKMNYAIKENKIIKYGIESDISGKFKLIRPIEEVVDSQCVVSVNGDIFVYSATDVLTFPFHYSRATDMLDADIVANFLELGGKIAIPLEHISVDTLKRILDIYVREDDEDRAMKEISRILYEELKTKGFEYEIKENKSEYRVTVSTKDGKKGVARISKRHSSIYYCCEYAPLAKTFYNYAKLHGMI